MTRREFDGKAQKRGLLALQKRTGRLPKDIGAALSVDTQTYRRYFWGKQPLRADMIPVVAAAYGVTTTELLEAVGLADTQNAGSSEDGAAGVPEGWDLRAELRAAHPHDPAAVDRLYPTLASLSYRGQLDAIHILRLAAGLEPRPEQAEDTHVPKTDQSRPSLSHTAG